MRQLIARSAFIAIMPVALLGCHSDCDCISEPVELKLTPPVAPPKEEAPAPKPAPATAPAAAPQVTGKWMGTWESAGHKGHGGGLNCEATEAGPQKWAATFTATYGPTKSYQVKLEGKLVEGAVVFGGTVDLGKADGGEFKWSGKATATAFTGKYEGGGDTGTFSMVRAPEQK